MEDIISDLIAIVFAIDWAPDEIIQYCIDLLEEYEVKATFFATHHSEYLKSLDSTRYEIGIHPNFNDGGDYNRIIKELKTVYPKAIGVCSHSLFQSSKILQLFIDNGLKYEMNTYVPLQEGLRPFTRLKGIVSIPFYWGDDGHFSTKAVFGLSELRIHEKGLKVCAFHPIHVFMNTNSVEHYDSFKAFYQEADILKKCRNSERGIQTLFIHLLQYLADNRVPTYLCRDIYKEYLVRTEFYELR